VKAFHQISVAPENIKKAAMMTPFRLFEFTKMPCRLYNAGQIFQLFIHEVTRKLDFVFVYLEDLLVFSPELLSQNSFEKNYLINLHNME